MTKALGFSGRFPCPRLFHRVTFVEVYWVCFEAINATLKEDVCCFFFQVDQAVQSAQQMYQSNSSFIREQLEKQRQYHQQHLETYKAAREQYLKKVEETVEFVKSKGITGTAKLAVDEVSVALKEARKLPGVVAKTVHDAFEKMMAMESVQKILENAQPAVQAAYTRYQNVHDKVVGSSSYKKLYDMSLSTMSQVQGSFIYRKAAENVYPFVAKYADPAMQQIAASPHYQALLTHVAPKQGVEAM